MYFAERFKDAMKDGGIALVVGLAPSAFEPPISDHARLVWWPMNHVALNNPKDWPELLTIKHRCRAILCTKYVSHPIYRKLQKYAEQFKVPFFGGLHGSGDASRMIHEAWFPDRVTDRSAPTPATEPKKEEAPMQTESHGTNGSNGHASAPPLPSPSTAAHDLPYQLTKPALRPEGFQTVTECIRYYMWDLVTMLPKPGQTRLYTHNVELHCEEAAKKVIAHGFDTNAHKVGAILSNLRTQYRVALHKYEQEHATQQHVQPAPAAVQAPQPPAPIQRADTLPEDYPLRDTLIALEEKLDELDALFSKTADIHQLVKAAADELQAARAIKTKYETLRNALSA